MTFSLQFFGGADEVTGSRHLLDTGQVKLLFDCGLFQGHRAEAIEKNRNFPFPISNLTTVLLSHAHIDHSGGLPLLAKKRLFQSYSLHACHSGFNSHHAS
jgi:metallo-beta-lactamase family protein